jgi:hypothetical protein
MAETERENYHFCDDDDDCSKLSHYAIDSGTILPPRRLVTFYMRAIYDSMLLLLDQNGNGESPAKRPATASSLKKCEKERKDSGIQI